MRLKSFNLLKLGTRLGTKVFSILLPSLAGRGLIVKEYYIGVKLLDSNLLILNLIT